MIVKLWRIRNVLERAKEQVGIGDGAREWRMHRHIANIGLNVAKPIAYSMITTESRSRFEMFNVEDLGKTTQGLPYLKDCIIRGDEDNALRFEETVIHMAHRLLDARIVDIDHQLNNILIDQAERIFRVDFECARRWRLPSIPHQLLGRTIGRLVCTHVYACQPNLQQSEQFATRLATRLQLPTKVLTYARRTIECNLARQRDLCGIDSRLHLKW